MKYQTVQHWSREELDNIVNDLIKKGWLPIGGVSTFRNGTYDEYTQAMVRFESSDDACMFQLGLLFKDF